MRIAVSLLFALAVATPGTAQRSREKSAPTTEPLGEAATATVANAFATGETWALQAMALLSMGSDWHPVGGAAVLAALQSKDVRLQAYGIEQLRRTDDRVLPSVCSAAIVDDLVSQKLTSKNELVRERALDVLRRALPDAGAADPAGFTKWWADQRAAYAAPAWTPRQQGRGGAGTVTTRLVEKAFDLRDAGLQVAFIVDSTGSMQRAIDAVRDAVSDITAILGGISPKLELGLVHYKDVGDMGEPGDVLVPLNKDPKKVRDRLAKLSAGGGGDVPEKVDAGLAAALGKEMGWKKEANRLLLVIGDAPPHAEDQPALLEMVKAAHDKPFQNPKRPTTGKQEVLRPFITSTIATNPNANPWFREIADAGGGTSVLLDLAAGHRKVDGKLIGPKAESAPEVIAQHVLRLSFGEEFAAQLDLFVDTFFTYRHAGAF